VNPSEITNRLIALVGDAEACELLETPNAELGGKTPQELLDAGDTAPVQTLLVTLELKERARLKWLQVEPLAVEMLVPDYQRGTSGNRPTYAREIAELVEELRNIEPPDDL
jgi:hypothetical protein